MSDHQIIADLLLEQERLAQDFMHHLHGFHPDPVKKQKITENFKSQLAGLELRINQLTQQSVSKIIHA